MESARIVGLLQDSLHGQLLGVREQARLPSWSHTCSTCADVSTALRVLKLSCSAGPHVNLTCGLQRAVRGAARAETCGSCWRGQ